MEEKDIQLEELMMEKLAGVIGEKDALYLESVMKKNANIRQEWEEKKKAYLASIPADYANNLNPHHAWEEVKHGIDEKKEKRRIYRKRWGIAASLMLPLLLAGWFHFYLQKETTTVVASQATTSNNVKLLVNGAEAINLSQYKKNTSISANRNIDLKVNKGSMSYVALQEDKTKEALNTLVIPATETYTITLSDGTEVSLNSMSQLKFSFSLGTEKREVWLQGEAYFDVAKDEKRPFIVHTAKTTVQVLGTRFNINTYDSTQIRTSLVSGAIKTTALGNPDIILKPGYEATYSPQKGFETHSFESNQVLSWMHGIYYFQNSSLKDIASVIQRWYGDTIAFAQPDTALSHYTGALLKNKPLKDFLDNLAFTSNIRYEENGGVIFIRKK